MTGPRSRPVGLTGDQVAVLAFGLAGSTREISAAVAAMGLDLSGGLVGSLVERLADEAGLVRCGACSSWEADVSAGVCRGCGLAEDESQ